MTKATINFDAEMAELAKNTCVPARTLYLSDLGYNEDSGWTIEGDVHEDYYEWVNYFEATHPDFGWVHGDFETGLEAKSKKALKHFLEYHGEPCEWDYWDI